MDIDKLKELILKGHSTYQIAKELNKSNSTIIYWISTFELDDIYQKRPRRAIIKKIVPDCIKSELEDIVKNSNSLAEVIRTYGKTVTGTNYTIIKRYISDLQLDTSHFIRSEREKKKEITTNGQFFSKGYFRSGKNLKVRLRKLIPFICSGCGVSETWNGKQLSLQVDHLDGDNTNNELSNLSIKCPNCHSQTNTFAGRNKKLRNILRDNFSL